MTKLPNKQEMGLQQVETVESSYLNEKGAQ